MATKEESMTYNHRIAPPAGATYGTPLQWKWHLFSDITFFIDSVNCGLASKQGIPALANYYKQSPLETIHEGIAMIYKKLRHYLEHGNDEFKAILG
jgi:hypothetical protein